MRHASPHLYSPSAHAAIIGGEIAKEGALPWMAWVLDERAKEYGQCSGTVVAPNLVLTAGHCAVDTETGVVNEPSGYSVVTGTTDWAEEAHRQVSGVSRVIVYPDFYLSGALEGWGDAALLELSTPTTAPSIPIASASESGLWEPGTPAIVAGWGHTFYEEQSFTERLRLAETVVQSPTWCQENAGGFHPLGQLCAINPPSFATGACEGDSGGPLVAEAGSGALVEIGIVRGGYGDCLTTEPNVFTRASLIDDWAENWIHALNPPPAPTSTSSPPSAPSMPPSTQPSPPAKPPTATPKTAPARTGGIYRGTTGQSHEPIALVIGSGERNVTAVATTLTYHCRSGQSFTSNLEGLSDDEPWPLESFKRKLTIRFTGSEEHQTISGTIDAGAGTISGSISAGYSNREYRHCSTGAVSWSAERQAAKAASAPTTPAGGYRGQTSQRRQVSLSVAGDGDALSAISFTAGYGCTHGRHVRLTEQALTPTDTQALEPTGGFTLRLSGAKRYSATISGTFGLIDDHAFGTLDASVMTQYGRCQTGMQLWEISKG